MYGIKDHHRDYVPLLLQNNYSNFSDVYNKK